MIHKSISYQYKRDFGQVLNDQNFEHKMKKSETKTADHWKDSYENKWQKSTYSLLSILPLR